MIRKKSTRKIGLFGVAIFLAMAMIINFRIVIDHNYSNTLRLGIDFTTLSKLHLARAGDETGPACDTNVSTMGSDYITCDGLWIQTSEDVTLTCISGNWGECENGSYTSIWVHDEENCGEVISVSAINVNITTVICK